MTLISAEKSRTKTIALTILDSAGDPITPGINDQVRVIIGKTYLSPILTVASNAPTDNGSSITKDSPSILRLDSADLEEINAGVYTLFFDYFDNADGPGFKTVDRQVFTLEESP